MRIAWRAPLGLLAWFPRRYNYDKAPASVWIRCLQLLPYLRALGVNCEVNDRPKKPDVAVYLRRWSASDLQEARRLRQQGVKIVLDTPVDYFTGETAFAYRGAVRDDFQRFLEVCHAVTCASPTVAAVARDAGHFALCLEDSVDPQHFRFRKQRRTPGDTLMWAGVAVKADCLNFLAEPIRRNGWNFVVSAESRPNLDFPFEFRRWRYRDFPEDILAADVGVFPRDVSSDYDRGHSFFKIGVFLAQHVPVAYSPVPSYAQVATPGNALRLDSLDPEAWERAIAEILAGNAAADFSSNPVEDFTTPRLAERCKRFFAGLIEGSLEPPGSEGGGGLLENGEPQ